VVPLQTGSMADESRTKHPGAEGGLPTGSSRRLRPAQVTLDHEGGGEVPSLRTSGEEMGLTPHPEVH
jgi:hypothetical protein